MTRDQKKELAGAIVLGVVLVLALAGAVLIGVTFAHFAIKYW